MVNIAFGSVLKIWHDYREAGQNNPEEAQLPPMDALEEAYAHTDIDQMIMMKRLPRFIWLMRI